MIEILNSEILKLISILLAIVVLFYIGLKNKPIDNKIKEIENHILNKLDSHQKTTLKAINDTFLDKKKNPSTDTHKLSDSIVQNFLAGTSNASISLLYMIDLYCKKAKNIEGKPPIANLHDVATAINGGKKDERFGMYLFACLVLLSSFGLLDYETIGDISSEVRFCSIDSTLVSYLDSQLEKRNLKSALDGLNQYIDSLFNDNTQEVHNDGSEINND